MDHPEVSVPPAELPKNFAPKPLSTPSPYTMVEDTPPAMSRDKTIKVTEQEKDKLDTVAKERFGTTEVPYGHTIKTLCDEELTRLAKE